MKLKWLQVSHEIVNLDKIDSFKSIENDSNEYQIWVRFTSSNESIYTYESEKVRDEVFDILHELIVKN